MRDFGYYFLSKVIPAILRFGLIVLLTHALSPSDYGLYATIIAIVVLVNSLVFGWMRPSILRFYPSHQGGPVKQAHFQSHNLSLLLGSLVCLCIGSVLTLWYLPALPVALTLGALVVVTPFNYFVTLYQATRQSGRYAAATLLQFAIEAVWVVGFVYKARWGYAFAVLGYTVGFAAATLFIVCTRRQAHIWLGIVRHDFDRSLCRHLLHFGVPMSLWTLSFNLLFLASRLIIGALRTADEVGIYASAYDIINGSISLLMTPFLLTMYPIIMQIWADNEDRKAVEQVITRISRYILLLMAPVFVLSFSTIGNLFELILGDAFGVPNWLVLILVLAAFLGQFSVYAHKGLEIARQSGTMLRVGLLTIALSTVLNLIFVGRFGYPSAAVVGVVAYTFYTVVVYHYSRAYITWYVPMSSLWRIVLAALLATGVWYGLHVELQVLQVWLCLSIEAGAILSVYLTTLLCLGELKPEQTLLWQQLKRVGKLRRLGAAMWLLPVLVVALVAASGV